MIVAQELQTRTLWQVVWTSACHICKQAHASKHISKPRVDFLPSSAVLAMVDPETAGHVQGILASEVAINLKVNQVLDALHKGGYAFHQVVPLKHALSTQPIGVDSWLTPMMSMPKDIAFCRWDLTCPKLEDLCASR